MQTLPSTLPPRYASPISFDVAKRVMAAAEAEATANQWPMVIAIVDSGGHLVMLHKLDGAQHGSTLLAKLKAETSVNFRRPTKVFEEAVAGGSIGLRVLSASNICAFEGGVPLMVDDEVIGAIGVSGMQSSQDAKVATAGAAVLLG